ncbi:hypothetical protein F2Q69_00044164 [Brassica cretica]|uniref:Uncharacterized protein n=1 Tax=Brassica cretica TaxID=69181 RepID=A0A8S9NK77_BRACR|nr:hypothetical protein F2Q69_00044164 [Brassica cretica]
MHSLRRNNFIFEAASKTTREALLNPSRFPEFENITSAINAFQQAIEARDLLSEIQIRSEIRSESAPKIGYPGCPDPNPDSKILDASKPNPNPDILIFRFGYPDPYI